MKTELSFDFPGDFTYLHQNNFGDEIDYLFYINSCQYIFWVNTINGVIVNINESSREEVDEFADNAETPRLTTEQYEAHKNDAKILNQEYLTKIQQIIDMTK